MATPNDDREQNTRGLEKEQYANGRGFPGPHSQEYIAKHSINRFATYLVGEERTHIEGMTDYNNERESNVHKEKGTESHIAEAFQSSTKEGNGSTVDAPTCMQMLENANGIGQEELGTLYNVEKDVLIDCVVKCVSQLATLKQDKAKEGEELLRANKEMREHLDSLEVFKVKVEEMNASLKMSEEQNCFKSERIEKLEKQVSLLQDEEIAWEMAKVQATKGLEEQKKQNHSQYETICELGKQLTNLQFEKKKIEDSNAKMTKDLEENMRQYQLTSEALDKLQEKAGNLQQVEKSLKQENDKKERELKSKADQISQLGQKVEELRDEKSGLHLQLKEIKRKHGDNIQKQKTAHSQELQKMKGQRDQYSQNLQQQRKLQQKRQEEYEEDKASIVKTFQTEIKKLQDQAMTLTTEVNSFRSHCSQLRKERDDLTQRLSEEWSRKVSSDESNIENISIKNRPVNIALDYTNICSNEWLDVKSDIDHINDVSEDDKNMFLCSVFLKAEEFALKRYNDAMNAVATAVFHPLLYIAPPPASPAVNHTLSADNTSPMNDQLNSKTKGIHDAKNDHKNISSNSKEDNNIEQAMECDEDYPNDTSNNNIKMNHAAETDSLGPSTEALSNKQFTEGASGSQNLHMGKENIMPAHAEMEHSDKQNQVPEQSQSHNERYIQQENIGQGNETTINHGNPSVQKISSPSDVCPHTMQPGNMTETTLPGTENQNLTGAESSLNNPYPSGEGEIKSQEHMRSPLLSGAQQGSQFKFQYDHVANSTIVDAMSQLPDDVKTLIGDYQKIDGDKIDIKGLQMDIEYYVAQEAHIKQWLTAASQYDSFHEYIAACARLAWKMIIQRPSMNFCTAGQYLKWDEKTQEPAFGGDDPKHPEAVVMYYVTPVLMHAGKLMGKGKVITKILK